jgi:hypothetical protein
MSIVASPRRCQRGKSACDKGFTAEAPLRTPIFRPLNFVASHYLKAIRAGFPGAFTGTYLLAKAGQLE